MPMRSRSDRLRAAVLLTGAVLATASCGLKAGAMSNLKQASAAGGNSARGGLAPAISSAGWVDRAPAGAFLAFFARIENGILVAGGDEFIKHV